MAKAAVKKAPAKKTPPWRSVESIKTLLKQVNTLAPKRSKVSDGSIGDIKHQARHSDHNAEPDGTVDAFDFTNDPSGGCDSRKLCEAIAASKDPRVSYLISNGQIMHGRMGAKGKKPWIWYKYTGQNSHHHHGHVSVLDEGQDDKTPWKIESAFKKSAADELTVKQVDSVLHNGSKGEYVEVLQKNLVKLGYMLPSDVDGDFGDGTEEAVKAFQKAMGLKKVDGWAGPATLEAMGKELAKVKLKPQIAEAKVKTQEAEFKADISSQVVDQAANGNKITPTEWLAGLLGTGGTISVARDVTSTVTETTKSFSEMAVSLGPWLLLGVVTACAAGYIIYSRRNVRLQAVAVKKVVDDDEFG